jgi:hypothetical protein
MKSAMPARLQHRLAVAELGRDIELDRHARELLQPIFGDHSGIKARPAGDDGDARHVGEAEVHLRQRHHLLERTQIGESVCATTIGCSKISFCI